MIALHIARMLVGGNAAGGYRRIGYLVVTVAVAVGAWLALSTIVAVMLAGSGTGRVIFPGVQIISGSRGQVMLPLRYMRRIEKIPGTRELAWQAVVTLSCSATRRAAIIAVGGPGTATHVLYETSRNNQPAVDRRLLARWQADPLGILIALQTTRECGWHTGRSIDPTNAAGQHILLHVVGTFHAAGMPVRGYAHYDYINRIGGSVATGKNHVMFAQARGGAVRDNERLAARITAAFAHDNPTVKATTDVTVQHAAARFGKVQQLLALVMAAVLLCAASILVSVLAHSAAQRRPRFALLQVLGFRRRTLFVVVVLESLATIVIGALIGIGLGVWMAHVVGTDSTLGQMFAGYDFTPPRWAYQWLPPWLAALLIAGLVAPTLVIRRTRPVEHRGG